MILGGGGTLVMLQQDGGRWVRVEYDIIRSEM